MIELYRGKVTMISRFVVGGCLCALGLVATSACHTTTAEERSEAAQADGPRRALSSPPSPGPLLDTPSPFEAQDPLRLAAILERAQRRAGLDYALSPDARGQVRLSNERHRLEGLFAGPTLELRGNETTSGWRHELELVSFGRTKQQTPALLGTRLEQNRIVLTRSGQLEEWYQNGPLGVEQGFDLGSAPPGQESGEELTLRLRSSGDLRAEREGSGVVFKDTLGRRKLALGELVVTDATGAIVPSRFEVDAAHVALVISDQLASYPLHVDPLLSYASMDQKLTSPGAAAAGQFGVALDLSGNLAVVGAPLENSSQGAAHVFAYSGGNWVFQQTLTAPTPAAEEHFGQSVAIDGGLIIVGAPGDGTVNGSAVVFSNSGGAWAQVEELLPTESPGFFGYSVDILGTRLLVGALLVDGIGAAYVYDGDGSNWNAPQKLQTNTEYLGQTVALGRDTTGTSAVEYAVVATPWPSGFTQQGAAYVFTETSPGTWSAGEALTPGDGAAGDRFGGCAAASGNRVVIGASNAESIGPASDQRGAAYVFVRSGGSWGLEQRLEAADADGDLDANGSDTGALFGTSVAISGTRVAIGAPRGSGHLPGAGEAYVFDLSGGTWSESEHYYGGSSVTSGFFGRSVGLSASALLVGALSDDGGASASGAAYAVRLLPRKAANFERLLNSSGDGIDAQGYSVAVRGALAVVGAPLANAEQGQAFVFTFDGSDWNEVATLVASDGAAGDQFGESITLSADAIVIGAPDQSGPGSEARAGAAYVFPALGLSGTVNESAKLRAPSALAGSRFGAQLSIASNTLVVGASHASTGSAFVFERNAGVWSTGTALPTSGLQTGDAMGAAVATDGLFAMVGAPGDDSNTGRIYVFKRGASAWEAHSELTASAPSVGDALGISVSLSNDILAVGAPQTGSGPGKAVIFHYDTGADTWTFEAELTAPLAEQSTANPVGTSVRLQGLQALVAATNRSYLFGRSGTTWSQLTRLEAGATAEQGSAFGSEHLLLGQPPVGAAVFSPSGSLGGACSSDFDCLSQHCVGNTCVECTTATATFDCDDGLWCNGTESCVSNSCQVGVDPVDDGIACTVDVCDEDTDSVTHSPDDTDCDDANACNGAETCSETLGCLAGTPIDTDDGVDCTLDTCEPATGQVTHSPNSSACSDADACNGIEYCDSVLGCLPGAAPVVDDGVDCTTDSCNSSTGLVTHVPNHTACDNGEACDGSELCDASLGCQTGTPMVCDDGVPCTTDQCTNSACVYTPNDAQCPGGLSCNATIGCTSCGTTAQECQTGGTACSPECTCSAGYVGNGTTCKTQCGDGIIAGSEVCDADAFGGITCESMGSATGRGGHLFCLDDCTRITATQCDADSDGVADQSDNCPSDANEDQLDSDGDANSVGGDACDPDDDNDGVVDSADPAPLDATLCGDSDGDTCDDCSAGGGFAPNDDGADTDADGICDAGSGDIDGDGVPNMADNCPSDANPTQGDGDGDGVGNVCDADRDGDGLDNSEDLCPDVEDPMQADTDHDGQGDFCDDDPGSGVISVTVMARSRTIQLGDLTLYVPANAFEQDTRVVIYESPAQAPQPEDARSAVYEIQLSSSPKSALEACIVAEMGGADAISAYATTWKTLPQGPQTSLEEPCGQLDSGASIAATGTPPDTTPDGEMGSGGMSAGGEGNVPEDSPAADGGSLNADDLLRDGGLPNLGDLSDEERDRLRDAGFTDDQLDDLEALLDEDGGLFLDGGIPLPDFPAIDTSCGCRIGAEQKRSAPTHLLALCVFGVLALRLRGRRGLGSSQPSRPGPTHQRRRGTR